MKKTLLTIILPTYNEAKNVKEILAQIFNNLEGSFEVLFIDDSTDETTDIILAEAAKDDRIRMIHRNPFQRDGLAGAFVEGFKHAKGEYICCMDSDLQHSPSDIPLLLKEIFSEDADIVVGSRYIKGGSAEGLGSFYRKIVSLVAKHVAKASLFPMKLGSDPGSGFFIFKKSLIKDVELFPHGFKILIEIIARTDPKKIVEVPIRFAPRENHESKANFAQGAAFGKHLSSLFSQVPRAGRFIKFCIVGSIGTLIYLDFLYLFVQYFHFDPLVAWGYAISIALICNFTLNSLFTYADHKSQRKLKSLAKFVRFAAASLLALAVNFYIYRTLLHLHVYYILAAFIGILFGAGINFAMAQHFVWKKKVNSASTHEPWKIWNAVYNRVFFSFLFSSIILGILAMLILDARAGFHLMDYFIPIFSIIVSMQGIFALFLMFYGWEDPSRIGKDSSPKIYLPPQFSLTAIIPARHEENVIEDTIQAVHAIDYPQQLKEILIVCREDDEGTIAKVKATIKKLASKNIKLIIFDGYPINKPHGLNIALKSASKDVVTIFDAEDEPHADIFNVINTIMIRDGVDVVQSGVQLMNYRSRWFSLYNVVEYYFWFKSTLHFFAKNNLIPLGGNTVFFKKEYLDKVGGWDEKCLTEDADVGIRLSLAGAKTRVVYDEQHVTKEETPDTVVSFIKQRTRWNQGFLQILFKKDWLKLPTFSQRLLAAYILTCPFIQAVMFLYAPVAIWMIFMLKLPAAVALIALFPLYILLLHFITYLIGLYEFTRDYNLKFPIWLPLKALIFYYPFQILMGLSVFRAIIRMTLGTNVWEKTEHLNLHRDKEKSSMLTPVPIKST